MLKIWDVKVVTDLEESEAENGTIVAVSKDSFTVKTKDGYLEVLELQLEGKKRMRAKDFLLGYKLTLGCKLGK